MDIRPDRSRLVSRPERIASIVVSTALAVAGALFVLTVARPRLDSAPTDTRRAERAAERLTYLAAPAATDRPGIVRRVGTIPLPSGILPRPPEAGGNAPPVVASPPRADRETRRAAAGGRAIRREDAGAPIAGMTVGIGHRGAAAVNVDSTLRAFTSELAAGLRSGRIQAPAPTQGEIDAKAREAAFADAAARARAPGIPPIQTAGGTVSIPLPFGGPSRKRRERERAEGAQAMEMMARVQRKADSILAARRRRLADSLARLPDSLLREPPAPRQ